eukprot:TRINITY_DN31572_c0_g1_i1.p1 TRINITY_DN31572_c0_g1~~TRINITY_DN31572_c0_g1_i1.p1  ORF type:complete len:344 (+),score=46.60 TRINITY_DN31572_c0_g1_i1:116-1147(+)
MQRRCVAIDTKSRNVFLVTFDESGAAHCHVDHRGATESWRIIASKDCSDRGLTVQHVKTHLQNSTIAKSANPTVDLYELLTGNARCHGSRLDTQKIAQASAAVIVKPSIQEMGSHAADCGDWTLEEVTLPSVAVYKVLGHEKTLAEYNQAQLDSGTSGSRAVDKDWSAMYTQFLISHTLGTVAYRWEDKHWRPAYSIANLVAVRIQSPLAVIIVTGKCFWDGSVDSTRKASLVKDELRARGWDIGIDEGLMEALGRLGTALAIQETENEWELVFEQRHLASVLTMPTCAERQIGMFYKHQAMPVTFQWEASADGIRRRCDDMEQCVQVLAELGETETLSRFTH